VGLLQEASSCSDSRFHFETRTFYLFHFICQTLNSPLGVETSNMMSVLRTPVRWDLHSIMSRVGICTYTMPFAGILQLHGGKDDEEQRLWRTRSSRNHECVPCPCPHADKPPQYLQCNIHVLYSITRHSLAHGLSKGSRSSEP
jgi:hypothetical protein